jgi:DNA-binding ferritin-like protein
MHTVATLLRTLQLYAHNAHNMASGPQFFADHEFLGELYPAYEAAYDAVVERIIGLGEESIDLGKINEDACAAACREDAADTAWAFRTILNQEVGLCSALAAANTNASLGTQNLLQGLADDSEKRQYQLRRRLLS